jgi:hypothetical protein
MEAILQNPHLGEELEKYLKNDDYIALINLCSSSNIIRNICNKNIWKKQLYKLYGLNKKPQYMKTKTWLEIFKKLYNNLIEIPLDFVEDLIKRVTEFGNPADWYSTEEIRNYDKKQMELYLNKYDEDFFRNFYENNPELILEEANIPTIINPINKIFIYKTDHDKLLDDLDMNKRLNFYLKHLIDLAASDNKYHNIFIKIIGYNINKPKGILYEDKLITWNEFEKIDPIMASKIENKYITQSNFPKIASKYDLDNHKLIEKIFS